MSDENAIPCLTEDGQESGWLKVPDASSGRWYFANPQTGEVAWELPEGIIDPPVPGEEGSAAAYSGEAAADGGEAAAAGSSEGGPLPDGWVEAFDAASGRAYYVHLASSTTTWDRPEPDPSSAAGGSAAGGGGGGHSKLTAASLSPEVAAAWASLADYLRLQATTKISAKNKKFAGLRKFAEIAARRKREAAKKKAEEDALEEAALQAAQAAASKPKRSMLSLLDCEVPGPVEKKDIEEFAEQSFELNRKGFFGAKTTVEKVLSWKNEVIRKALLKMPTRELESTAVQLFRNVTGFMGDRNTHKEDAGHAEKVLKTCLHAPEELRDEVYCQVIKQTTNNPSSKSALKGWELLGILAGAFAPSKDFEPYLLSHCDQHREQALKEAKEKSGEAAKEKQEVAALASYTMGRIVKTGAMGPRREVPTPIEIEACKKRDVVLVRVYHLDGSYDMLPVTSWVTPTLIKAMVCEIRGIQDGSPFAVYEMTPEGEERFLESDERILDLVSYWQRLFEEEKAKGEDGQAQNKKQKKKAVSGNNFYRLVFKTHMYFEPSAEDHAAQKELYAQACYDVVSARYPCSEKDCVSLGALQLQAEYGDKGLPDATLKEKVGRYLPSKYCQCPANGDEAKFAAKLEVLLTDLKKAHKTHAGKSTRAAETEYLSTVKEWQVYGSSFFFVEPQMSADLPDEVFLAVNPKGILIINPDTKEVLATHPYSEVPTWGHSGSSFVLHIGNLIKQTKLYFSTEQGKEINDLVRAYVNHLCVTS